MRISEFGKEKVRSFLNRHSTIRIPHGYSLAQQWILLVLAFLILGLLLHRFYVPSLSSPPDIRTEFAIEVTGDIRKPGIFIFQAAPALREAIEKAGGVKDTGLLKDHLLSQTLETGTLLTVTKESSQIPPHPPLPKRGNEGRLRNGEQESFKHSDTRIKIGRMAANKLLVCSIPLDLNRVSVEDLCLVPGIGDSLAREIVAHRERRRGFRSVSELKNVKGIGEKKYQTYEKYLVVRP